MNPLSTHAPLTVSSPTRVHSAVVDIDMCSLTEMAVAMPLDGTTASFSIPIDYDLSMCWTSHSKTK